MASCHPAGFTPLPWTLSNDWRKQRFQAQAFLWLNASGNPLPADQTVAVLQDWLAQDWPLAAIAWPGRKPSWSEWLSAAPVGSGAQENSTIGQAIRHIDCANAPIIRHANEHDLAFIARFDEMGGDRRQEIASRCCLVAEQHGHVVAYASFQPAGLLGQLLLSYLCAAPSARGQGIGRLLVEAIQRIASGRMLLSSTEAWCVASQKIFSRLGWRKIGELAGVNKDGSTEYFYAIDLHAKPED